MPCVLRRLRDLVDLPGAAVPLGRPFLQAKRLLLALANLITASLAARAVGVTRLVPVQQAQQDFLVRRARNLR